MAKPRKQTTAQSTEKKEKEDPRATFVRLGEPRLAAVVKRILILQNVARYPHSEKQAAKVMDIVKAAVTSLEASFGPKSAAPTTVSLADE